MPVTFRSGPRDPVTGQSSAVVSDPGNIVRASGQTDNERAARQASYNVYEPGQAGSPEVNQAAAQRAAQRASVARTLGITDNNPYGNMSRLSRALGAENVSYAGNMSLNQRRGIANLMIDRYLNPVNPATGRVRPGLDAGDPTQYGPVGSDPSLRRSYGIASMIPGVSFLTSMFDKSDLTVPGFTDYQNEQMSLGMAADAADVVGGPVPEPLSFGLGLDAVDYDTMAYYDSSYGVDRPVDRFVDPDAVNARAEQNRAISSSSLRVDDRLIPMRFAGDQSGLGDELEEFPQAPIPTEMTASKRTVVADPSRMVTLPPVPEPSLPYVPTLDDAFSQQARQDLIEAERRRGDRLDFMLDMIPEQPKAFEPRAPLPPMPISPPPMFNEQVDLTDPALYGLSGFRP